MLKGILKTTLAITALSLSMSSISKPLMVGFAGSGVVTGGVNVSGDVSCDSSGECSPGGSGNLSSKGYWLYSGQLTNNSAGSESIYSPIRSTKTLLSSYAPALTWFNNTLFAAYIEKDTGKLRTAYSASSGLQWNGFNQINGNTGNASPAMVEFNGKLYVAFRGKKSHKLYMARSSDGINWEATRRIGSAESSHGPSLAVHNGKLWVSYRGVKSKKLYYGYSNDGVNWIGGGKLGYKTSNTPYIASHNGKIYMAYKGSSSDNLYIVSSANNGGSWSREFKLPSAYRSNRGPAISSYNGKLYLAFKGMSSRDVLYATSYNGTSWSSVRKKPGSHTSGSLHLTK